jgi:hypothetical protein
MNGTENEAAMGFRMARVAFPDGTAMYTTYTTVTDCCARELLPAAVDDVSWIACAESREETDQRLDTVCRRNVGMTWNEYQRSIPIPDVARLPDDVEEVRITVPNYDDEGWTSKASKGARVVVGPTSTECAAGERTKEQSGLLAAERAAQTTKARYVVRDRTGHALLETDSRLVAWWSWFRRRGAGATAHDRRSWVEDDRSWLRCGDLPPGKRVN